MKKKYLLLLLFLILINSQLSAQAIYEVPVHEKFANSTLVVEGKVISQESFWNLEKTMIFTSNQIEVLKVFKGSVQKQTIEVITHGGNVGNIIIEASDLLSLQKDQVGVFFCMPKTGNLKKLGMNEVLYDVYSSNQGFFSYDLEKRTAAAPFVRYDNIVNNLYKELVGLAGRNFENRKPSFDLTKVSPRPSSPLAPAAITSFSPSTVNAGAHIDVANNLLTITGTAFGTATGLAAVLFDDADNGPGGTPFTVAATDNIVVSWTDTEIQIRVPSKAGTGTFSVRDAAGVSTNSPTPLNVLFSILAPTFTSGGTFTKESNLMNDNGTGGYSVLYSTNTAGAGINFDAAPEKATFQRALTTWREVSGVNFSEGGTTAIQTVTGDGNNLVVFDNTNAGAGVTPLPAGVLAVCYSFNSACLPLAGNSYQKTEFDIVVRNPAVSSGSVSFTIGPCPPMSSNSAETDLETVLLHELGHALNLGHINDGFEGMFAGELNPGKLMHFQIVNSAKRVSPDFSAKQGAAYAILPQGNNYGGPCGLLNAEMVPLVPIAEARDECPVTFPTNPTPLNTVVNFDLVHATSNRFTDPAYTQADCSAIQGIGITNNAYYAFRTNATGGIVSLSVSGYSTIPALPATCATIPPNFYPTKGVELLLYQVNSCPVGQSFPNPIACRSFDGNGALTNFTGLAANTNYLIMVDGIENTKANFSLTFTGSALPINLSDFSGEVLGLSNRLSWTIEFAKDVKAIYLQRSPNSVDFENIAEVSSSILTKKGKYEDKRPYTGDNFYRLVTVNLDETKEFSKTILLKRKDAILVNVFPNPASTLLNIEINAEKRGRFTILLHNNLGQLVDRKEVIMTSGRQLTNFNISKHGAGLYNVSVLNENQELIMSDRITVQ